MKQANLYCQTATDKGRLGIKSKKFALTLMIAMLNLFIGQALGQQRRQTTIQDGVLIPNVRQDPKSDAYYRYTLPANRRPQYLAITVDPLDAQSDPDIFISKTNQFPRTEADSDQTCLKAGTKLCFLRRNYLNPGENLFIGARCTTQCTYSMQIHLINQVTALQMNQTLRVNLGGRSLSVYQVQIGSPEQLDGVQFNVDTLSLETPMQLYLSRTDELANIDEEDIDIVTETGKSIRFSNGDFGWCNGGASPCTANLIISTRSTPLSQYSITARSLTRRDIIQTQVPFSKVFDFTRGQECLSLNVARSTGDLVMNIKTLQGDSELSVIQRNSSFEQAIVMSELVPSIPALDTPSRTLILRSFDRARIVVGSSPVMNLCVNAFSTTSLQVTTNQRFFSGRFDLQEDTATTFILDSRDYLYFRFTSFQLAQAQNLTLSLQASRLGQGSILLTPPRIAFRVCQSTLETECSLTETEAFTGAAPMTLLPGTVNTVAQLRQAIINHRPQVCAEPTSCHYLISVFNPDLIQQPMRVTLRLSLSNFDVTPIQLNSRFVNLVGLGQYQYFQVTFTPQQLSTLNLGSVQISLTSLNGRAELYVSQRQRNPQYGMPDVQQASSISFVNSIDVRVINTSQPIFIGVLGATQAQYQLRVDALQFTQVFPQSTGIPSAQVPVVLNVVLPNGTITLNDKEPQVLQMSNPNRTDVMFSYVIPQITPQQAFLAATQNRTIVLVARVLTQTSQNTSLQFNLTAFNSLTGLRTAPLLSNVTQLATHLVLDNNFSAGSQLLFNLRATFNTRGGLRQNATVQVTAYTMNQNGEAVILRPNTTSIEGVINGRNAIQIYRTGHMDFNATYRFNLRNIYGNMALMVEHNLGTFNASQRMRIADDTSFDFASRSIEFNEAQEIRVDQRMRDGAHWQCRNSSLTINGGSRDCTIYQALQCLSDLCIFNYSLTMASINNARFTDQPPALLSDIAPERDIVTRNRTLYYFLPYTRQTAQNVAILLSKVNGDSFFFGRVIQTAQTPYQTWNYPTLQSNDFVQRSLNISTNELIEISGEDLASRCAVNASCAIIIGVLGNQPQLNQSSMFTLTLLSQRNQVLSNNALRGMISRDNSFDYYWFTVNSRPNSAVNSPLSRWTQMIIVGSNSDNARDVDLYVSVFSGRIPTEEDFDYKSERNGPDNLVISSTDALFTSRQQLLQSGPQRILFIVGIKGSQAGSNYTLMNWGPNLPEEAFFASQDLTMTRTFTTTFQPRDASFRLFRYFSYGMRDLQLNLTSTEGSAYLLMNAQPFRNSQSDRNSFLNIPIFNATSRLPPIQIPRGQNLTLRLSQLNRSPQNAVWCTNCWYYFAVFQNLSSPTRTSVQLNLTEIRDPGVQNLINIRPGQRFSDLSIVTGQQTTPLQFRMVLDSKMPFMLNITSNNPNVQLNVSIGMQMNGSNPLIFNALSTSVFLNVRQSDTRFEIGTPYFIAVQGFSRAGVARATLTISLQQLQEITLLKSRIVDRMWNPQDLVKYYYLAPPSAVQNFTAQVTITTYTPGFQPMVYLQRNDMMYNLGQSGSPLQSFNLSQSVRLPTVQRFTQSFERPFWQALATNYTFTVPIVQTVIQTSTNWIVNGTNRVIVNQMVNQTWQALGIYWVNHGFTDLQKAEYEITVRLTPTGNPVVPRLFEGREFRQNLISNKMKEYNSLETQESTEQQVFNNLKE